MALKDIGTRNVLFGDDGEKIVAKPKPTKNRYDFRKYRKKAEGILAELDSDKFSTAKSEFGDKLVKASDTLKYEESDALSNWTIVGILELSTLLEDCFSSEINAYKDRCIKEADRLDNNEYQKYLYRFNNSNGVK